MKTAETKGSTNTLPKLPATGTLKKNVHPYKMGGGTIESIEEFLRAGKLVTIKGVEEKILKGEPCKIGIFEMPDGQTYGLKLEDIELPN